MELLFFWVAFSVLVAVIANSRRRNWFGWLLLSLLLTPLLGLIAVLALPSRAASARPYDAAREVPSAPPVYHGQAATKICRSCAEVINARSTYCHRCNHPVGENVSPVTS